jgi:cytochrome b subunit of formate dehydrogenase
MTGKRFGSSCGLVALALSFLCEPLAAQEKEGRAPARGAEGCLGCHASKDITRKREGGSRQSLFVNQEALKDSVHAALRCGQCHDRVPDSHPREAAVPPARCDPCHSERIEEYEKGVHGRGGINKDRKPIGCGACHGPPHAMLSSRDTRSPTHRRNVPDTCGGCHGKLKMVVEEMGESLRRPLFAYQASVHGQAVKSGLIEAAVCTDCHGSHDVLPGSDSDASISRFKVPETCGRCHATVFKEYRDSVHGVASQKGISRAPVCTDCHGIHSIKTHLDPSSSVAVQAIARTTCPQCHQSVSLQSDLGLPLARVETYLDSYHGLASQRGSTVVANCASCHGVHSIFPSSDPRSSIHASRLATTCSKCHPGASESFTRGKIHEIGEARAGIGAALVRWTGTLYRILIGLTVGAMVLHNLLDLRRKVDPRHRSLPQGHLQSKRLDLHQRIQHALLASSFMVLVLSGFALKFPTSWLSSLFGQGETLRRSVHRGAAVAMVVLAIYHLFYLAAFAGGRRALRHLLPRRADLREAAGTVAFNFGKRAERPEKGHFGYAEKVEYWALVWGTVIMAATGFLLWFKMAVTEWLGWPLWAVDLAEVVHYYEAWLATLAIITWHFYFVVFDPSVYPMNWAWLTGWIRPRPPAPDPPSHEPPVLTGAGRDEETRGPPRAR